MKHHDFMEVAYQQALIARNNGNVPVGAVLIHKDSVFFKSYNSNRNSIGHAEINIINSIDDSILRFSKIYITMEPCHMCISAISIAKIPYVYFGTYNYKLWQDIGGAEKFSYKNLLYKTEIYGGILEEKCNMLFDSFF